MDSSAYRRAWTTDQRLMTTAATPLLIIQSVTFFTDYVNNDDDDGISWIYSMSALAAIRVSWSVGQAHVD